MRADQEPCGPRRIVRRVVAGFVVADVATSLRVFVSVVSVVLGATFAAPRTARAEVLRLPAPARVVAIGDLHGDLESARRALRLAGAIDDGDRWIGGRLVVVQTGDVLDRGDDERALLALLERLAAEAAAAGGRVVALNGNHELMNVEGDFRYVTAGGFAAYGGVLARRRAFVPGGALARGLAGHAIAAIVGDTLFVHAGVRPADLAAGLDALDDEARAWLRGDRAAPPRVVADPEGPLWTRLYGGDERPDACRAARAVLLTLGLRRMVVGHTVQARGVNPICDGLVWRVDVGLARAYGGAPQVLEIAGGAARALPPR